MSDRTPLPQHDPIILPAQGGGEAVAPAVPQQSARGGTSPRPRRPRRWPWVVGIALLALVLAVGGAAAYGLHYFQSHVPPGVQLMGEDVTGLTRAQVTDRVKALEGAYAATLTRGEASVHASAAELGIRFDEAATVDAVMNPPDAGGAVKNYSPWEVKPVNLVLSVDRPTLQAYLDGQFIAPEEHQVPAGVTYDEANAAFSVIPSVTGVVADAESAARALEACEGLSEPVQVGTVPEPPRITDGAAQATVDQANQRVNAPLVLRAGKQTYTIPPTSVGYWLTFTPDTDLGAIALGYASDQVAAQVPVMLNANLATPPTNEEIMYSPDGVRLGVLTRGKAGSVVADPAGVAAQVLAALQAGTGLDTDVALAEQPYVSLDTPMPAEYLQANGAKWVRVNLSDFTVTAWNGSTEFAHSKVVTGGSGGGKTPTRPGVFHVYSKVASQTMKGTNPDGSEWKVENVPWIAYYDGGIALHGAYWRPSFGYADSHGCVNMPVAFAKKLYDWIEIGTLVIVSK